MNFDKIIPNLDVSCKLGSMIIHLQEAMSDKAHNFDMVAIKSLLEDKELNNWLEEMQKMALLPKKRGLK